MEIGNRGEGSRCLGDVRWRKTCREKDGNRTFLRSFSVSVP